MAKRKRLSNRELDQLLRESEEAVPVGSIWRHFKGGDYKVVCIAFDSEDLQLEVVHESIDYPGITFTRSMSNWLESVNFEGFTLSRFEHMED
jgi:hypothetical protein